MVGHSSLIQSKRLKRSTSTRPTVRGHGRLFDSHYIIPQSGGGKGSPGDDIQACDALLTMNRGRLG